MSSRCLLEIGTEELPAGYIPPALDQLRREVATTLGAAGLAHGEVVTLGTPRRLALFVDGLPPGQGDRVERVSGPPEGVAFKDDQPTKAAVGFAQRQGVGVEALEIEETPKGRYVTVEKRIPGRPTAEILTEVFTDLIPRLAFPKTMTWGAPGLRFARPVRWLVALFDDQVMPVEVGGLRAGRQSQGHRFLNTQGEPTFERADLALYRETLRRCRVVADVRERTDLVREQVTGALGSANGTRVIVDEDLVQTVANLVEWPTAMVGSFEEAFLEVPGEVLQTAMIHHQKYFPVARGEALTNRFVFVSNGSPEHAAAIVTGNERVLRARLADAQFFHREDRAKTLAEHAAGLDTMTWHERLGSYAAKAARMSALAQRLAARLGLEAPAADRLAQAAELCKADLMTSMVYEFPELQGTRALNSPPPGGGHAEVAQAIEEHYQPRAAGDALPTTPTGTLLSLIDKIDSIVGCFRIGLAPTGSQDPYALRRQALGLVRMLRAHPGWDLPLAALVAEAAKGYADLGAPCDAEVVDFIKQRLRHLLIDEGARAEVVDAIFVTPDDAVPSLCAKVAALAEIVDQPDFVEIAHAAKRVLNILRQAEGKMGRGDFPRPAGGEATEPAERALAEALPTIQAQIAAAWQRGAHADAFRCLATLRPQVDAFFDNVRVMAEDERVRDFRLALLAEFRALFHDLADISRIAVDRE